MKSYPSIKREKLIVAIKEGNRWSKNTILLEFHDHAKETDPKKIEAYIKDAEAGLKQIHQFENRNHRGSFTYTLGEWEKVVSWFYENYYLFVRESFFVKIFIVIPCFLEIKESIRNS